MYIFDDRINPEAMTYSCGYPNRPPNQDLPQKNKNKNKKTLQTTPPRAKNKQTLISQILDISLLKVWKK